ncbi:MAG: hypothetical protein K8S21_04390 [Gemmatimonadetes bacterium]|nr:hypothetical protein [Gemmatimonadota bacterium]
MTIVLVAFVAATALAQRQRGQMRQAQAVLVARAHEEERAWVASELHDDVLQRVALVRAEIESLWEASEPRSADALEDRLRGINAELVDLAVAVRRIAVRLHPTVVDQVGLVSALQSLADEVERGSDLDVRLTADGDTATVPADTARAAYRIAQESLRNAVKHSGARIATIGVRVTERTLSLSVHDDGRGFDTNVKRVDGLGLASLQERALCVGGKAEVRSRPGAGTTIDATLPLPVR